MSKQKTKRTTLRQYANFTTRMWITKTGRRVNGNLAVMALGLGGEVQEHIKKLFRDGTFNRKAFVKELGDVIYYWTRICKHFKISPDEVIATNIKKITGRRKRGTVRGSGNDR